MDNEALGWNWENAISVFVSGLFYLVCFLGTVSKKKKNQEKILPVVLNLVQSFHFPLSVGTFFALL